MTLFIWVTIKICRSTRSSFALTLLSFTFLFAIACICFVIPWDYRWKVLICECLISSAPMQSWLFAMQYFKSYLYTCAGADSVKYKIHTLVKYTVIVAYTAVIIYFWWRAHTAYAKLFESWHECYVIM
jgi:hypothetical protein